ncbi:hypothetical protein GCM10022294_22830 [Dietzia aurantiaca]
MDADQQRVTVGLDYIPASVPAGDLGASESRTGHESRGSDGGDSSTEDPSSIGAHGFAFFVLLSRNWVSEK